MVKSRREEMGEVSEHIPHGPCTRRPPRARASGINKCRNDTIRRVGVSTLPGAKHENLGTMLEVKKCYSRSV